MATPKQAIVRDDQGNEIATINIPEGATQQQVQNKILQVKQMAMQKRQASSGQVSNQPEQAQDEGNWYDRPNQFMQGVTMGFADEISSGMAAGAASLIDGADFGDAYRTIKEQMDQDRTSFEKNNRGEALALEMAGGVATGIAGGAKLAGSKLLSGISKPAVKGAAVGATEGAIYASGKADDLEDVPYEAFKGAAVGGVTGGVADVALRGAGKYFKNRSELKKLLEEGSSDAATAKWQLAKPAIEGVDDASRLTGPSSSNRLIDKTRSMIEKAAPGIKKDREAVEAIKQGFDEGVIAAIKNGSRTDKQKMATMAKIAKQAQDNKSFGMKNRATDVAGKTLLKRFQVVKNANKNAAQELSKVAENLKGKQVDYTPAVNQFLRDLDDMGVKLGKDLKPVFQGSDIEGIDAAEKAILRTINRMARGKVDAYDVHRMKRYIDESVSYGRAGEGLTGKTESVLKTLRRNLDQVLDESFPEYDAVNKTYAETIQAIDALQDVAGKKMNLSGENADKAVGTLLRRLESNAVSRVNLLDAVNQLDEVAVKHGLDVDENLLNQILFAEELDNVFGIAARNSFAGQAKKGVKQGIDAATTKEGAFAVAMDKLGEGAEKLRGINPDNALKAITDLLNK